MSEYERGFRDAIEAAAKKCEEYAQQKRVVFDKLSDRDYDVASVAGSFLTVVIRALKPAPPPAEAERCAWNSLAGSQCKGLAVDSSGLCPVHARQQPSPGADVAERWCPHGPGPSDGCADCIHRNVDIAELLTLRAEAPPGLWFHDGRRAVIVDERGTVIARCYDAMAPGDGNASAALIAAVVNALPMLLDEIDALRAAARGR